MYNMGIGGSDHDISICVTEDETIGIALDEERVTRLKYGIGSDYLKGNSRKYCLNSLGLKLEDMKNIVATDILAPSVYFPIRNRVTLINHHMGHASSAFYPSGFDSAAILVADNGGSIVEYNGVKGAETITYAVGKENKINVLSKVLGFNWNETYGDSDNSLGRFYKMISKALGFVFYTNDVGIYKDMYFTEDGKTMGLASYGKDTYYELIKKYVELLPEGQLNINLNDGTFEKDLESILKGENNSFQVRADIAFAGQKVLEEALIHCTSYLYEVTKEKNLCIAGGIGLNSVANAAIIENTGFEQIFIQPASGDNGIAIGCAYYAYYVLEGKSRNSEASKSYNAYFGPVYDDNRVEESLKMLENKDVKITKETNITKKVAKLLTDQKIIGWFQGESEFGPRALGHRSIIVDPRNPNMKDILNHRVKKREGFRPFAPSVLDEYKHEYFDNELLSPYMLLVCRVVKEKQAEIPAVTHVDGTARVQTVTKKDNGIYYDLINEFYKITNTPVLLNTSFNIKGEPIVETPEDAIRCFLGTDIDCLILHDILIEKQ